jgi:phenylalanyl-tRNA synthetase beta subunit
MNVIIDGHAAGLICELHPKVYEAFEIRGNAVIFDLSQDMLFRAGKKTRVFSELQRYPEVPFEFSVVADEFAYAREISDIIAQSNKMHISAWRFWMSTAGSRSHRERNPYTSA